MCGYKHFGHYILLIVMPVFGIMVLRHVILIFGGY